VRPRRLMSASGRPLNFTVRGEPAPISAYGASPIRQLYFRPVTPSFEWDPAEDAENQRKHGVAFVDAQLAFLDPARVIAKDLSHSKDEPRSMKRSRKYRDEPLERVEVIDDFLPPPDQLVLRDDGVKVTISLSKRSVEFFKRHAARSKVPYQKMIRSLLDSYARHHGADL